MTGYNACMSKVLMTRGASATRRWVLSKTNVNAFARVSGVDRKHLKRIIDGLAPRVGPVVAARIERATNGNVKAIWFFEPATLHEVAA